MNDLKAILFDMDGLIFDTEGLYKACWQQAVKDQGLLLSDEYYQQFIGVQDAQCEALLEILFAEKLNMKQFKTARDKLLETKSNHATPYKLGFKRLFTDIKTMGLKCALVTSSNFAQVRHHFTDNNYLTQFDTIITSEDVEKGKPEPDCYLMACQQLNILPQHSLVLEDSNNGMRAALKAGCFAIMIPDLQQADVDVAAKASAVLSNLNEIKQFISTTH